MLEEREGKEEGEGGGGKHRPAIVIHVAQQQLARETDAKLKRKRNEEVQIMQRNLFNKRYR